MGRTYQSCRNTTIRLRCSASKCTTPLYKLKHLKSLPKSVDGLPPEAKKTFLENEFGSVVLISSLRCCGACYVRLHRLSSSVDKSVPQPLSVNNSVQNQVGRPSISYEQASKRTQRRIRNKLKTCARQKVAELKTEVENMGASYEEICQEILEGQFDGVQEKVNVQHGNANIVEGLALSYSREKPGSRKRVELLSCVAQQYTNKELKQMFRFTNSRGEEVSCTDYELTKARLHSKMYGPGAALPKIRRQYSHKLPPETIAFVLELVHHPHSVEYSSYKTAPVMENINH